MTALLEAPAQLIKYRVGLSRGEAVYVGQDRAEAVAVGLRLRAVHGSDVMVAAHAGGVYVPVEAAGLMADVLRPDVARVPFQRRSQVAGCPSCVEGAAPHDAAVHCQSGRRAHCTCDGACY